MINIIIIEYNVLESFLTQVIFQYNTGSGGQSLIRQMVTDRTDFSI
jgi:hypothetical protein